MKQSVNKVILFYWWLHINIYNKQKASKQMIQNNISVTFKSAPNIALVKYWGKYNQSEIIPINDSLGITLNTDDLSSTTTITFSRNIEQDVFILNKKVAKINNRMITVLAKVREKARNGQRFRDMEDKQWNSYHFKIQSENSFPSASGMASSASGFSCLAAALNNLFGQIFNNEQLSRLARSGSGSASRALYGGLVRWRGVDQKYLSIKNPIAQEQLKTISEKSISFPVLNYEDISFIKIIALITENKEKEVSSTLGMRTSMQTSEYIKCRNKIANERIDKITELITMIGSARKNKNKQEQYILFGELSEHIIRDSNSFHAVCLDTYPPIFYLNQFSRQIISIVDKIINKESKLTKVAYTFDAGPHGFIFVHEDMLEETLSYLFETFDSKIDILNPKARNIVQKKQNTIKGSTFSDYVDKKVCPKGIWVTDAGRGAQKVEDK